MHSQTILKTAHCVDIRGRITPRAFEYIEEGCVIEMFIMRNVVYFTD